MSFTKTTPLELTVWDLLTLDKSELVRYLQSKRGDTGGFVLSNPAGFEKLSKGERDELGKRLSDAAEVASAVQSIGMDALTERLTSIADADGYSKPKCLCSPPMSPVSDTCTEPPLPDHSERYQAICYHELIKDGGKPVCSIEETSHMLAEPTASHEPARPWFIDLDPHSRNEEIKTVFPRQLEQWWHFRKWQLVNRGIDELEGFPEYLASNRRIDEYLEEHRWIADKSYERIKLGMWQDNFEAFPYRPIKDGLPVYEDAVERNLAIYNFKLPLQLMENPREQSDWTTWLEYLSYEKWWLDKHTAVMERGTRRYYEAWYKFIHPSRAPPAQTQVTGKVMSDLNDDPAATGSATSPSQKQLPGTKRHQLKMPRPTALKVSNKRINDFINDSRPYRRAEMIVRCHKSRVRWIVKQASAMEAEMLQKDRTVGNDQDTGERRKRKQIDEDDDDGISPEPWSKRIKRGVEGHDMVQAKVSEQRPWMRRPRSRSI